MTQKIQGARMGDYVLNEKLGEGRFSAVWSTQNENDVVKLHRSPRAARIEIDNFENIGSHPNVVSFVCASINPPFIVLKRSVPLDEIIRGGCFAKKSDTGPFIFGASRIARAKKMIVDLFAGISHIHAREYIHGDIKPANLLWNGTNLCISDLGSSIGPDTRRTFFIGTRNYCAPEILLGLCYDKSIDVWAASATIFEIFFGDTMFDVYFSTAQQFAAPLSDSAELINSETDSIGSDNSSSSSTQSSMDTIDDYRINYDHLLCAHAVLGPLPPDWRSEFTMYYNTFGELKNDPKVARKSISVLARSHYNILPETARNIEALISSGMKYRPEDRLTAFQLSFNSWLCEEKK